MQYSKFTPEGSFIETDDVADFPTTAETIEFLQTLSAGDTHADPPEGIVVLAGTVSGNIPVLQADVVATAINGVVVAHSLPNDE